MGGSAIMLGFLCMTLSHSYIGIVCGIIGMILGNIAMRKSQDSMYGVIGTVISIAGLVIGIYMNNAAF